MTISIKSGKLEYTITKPIFEKIKCDWIHATIQYLKSKSIKVLSNNQKVIRNELIYNLEDSIEYEQINYDFFNLELLEKLTEFTMSGVYLWINEITFSPEQASDLLETSKNLEPFLSHTYNHHYINVLFENSIEKNIPIEIIF